MAGVTARSGGAFVAFRNPNFKWHWFSTLASFSAMQMQGIALGILGWEMSHSYTVVGILQAAFALPMAILAPPGGALVDRMEKRRVIAFSQALLAILGVATAALIQADLITIVLLFAGGLVQGAMFSLNGPARTTMVTEVVTIEEIPAAVSLQTIAMNCTRVAAPAVAGILVALVSVAGSYYTAGAMYVCSVIAILQVTRTVPREKRPSSALMGEMIGGVRYVFSSRVLLSLLLSALTVALFVMPYQVMLPGFADDLGHAGLFGAMIAVSGVGGLLGSLGAASISNHPRKPYIQFFLGIGAGLSLIALGVLSGPLGAAGAFLSLALVGGTATSYMTLNQAMLLTEADPAYRGRVMSLSMLTFSAMPLMALPLGVLADLVGGRVSFVTQGAIATTAILVLALANRRHTFGRRDRQA